MIKLCDSEKCCGCTACASACTRGAINMHEDEEGFLQPFVNESKCVDCGLCRKVCPVINKPIVNHDELKHLFAIQNKNNAVREQSPSGGFFSLLATCFINQLGGYVCGAVFSDGLVVKHLLTNDIKEIPRFSGSKYVQSDIRGIYQQISKLLKNGEKVLFSGTPCQVNGLVSYLRKPYSNLFTVELVCHGVPSPKFWKTYLEYQQNVFGSPVIKANFRSKKYGFKSSSLMLKFENGRVYYGSHDSDFMLRPFSQNESLRWSCYNCNFKGVERTADYTIYDGWHIGIWNKSMNDDKGTTLVYCHNDKAYNLFQRNAEFMKVQEVSVDDPWAIRDAIMMYNQPKVGSKRNLIYKVLATDGFYCVTKQILPITLKLKIKTLAKRFLGSVGVMSIIGKIKSLH